MDKSGVSVSGLKSVVVNTAVVTKAGSASYSVAKMVASTAIRVCVRCVFAVLPNRHVNLCNIHATKQAQVTGCYAVHSGAMFVP